MESGLWTGMFSLLLPTACTCKPRSFEEQAGFAMKNADMMFDLLGT
jgi:hypothetical protein